MLKKRNLCIALSSERKEFEAPSFNEAVRWFFCPYDPKISDIQKEILEIVGRKLGNFNSVIDSLKDFKAFGFGGV